MARLLTVLLVFVLGMQETLPDEAAPPLRLKKCLPVDGPSHNQPSGLTMRDGALYAVSDKHDDTIFRVDLRNGGATMVPHVTFEPPGPPIIGGCDFEGITSDSRGSFYLVSETHCRVLRVSADGKEAVWVTSDLEPAGKGAGLLQVWNAGLEGIAWVGGGRVILCAERQPRGLLEVAIDKSPAQTIVHSCDGTKFRFENWRAPDFSGLWWENDALYVLERNAFVVCRMTRSEKGFEEGRGWSYEHIVMKDELRYVSMQYGKAEGLCMDADTIYLILDNNGMARKSKPDDTRPLLLLLDRPKEW